MNKEKFHLIFGITMVSLGAFGIVTGHMEVVDIISGAAHFFFIFAGLTIFAFGWLREKYKKVNLAFGSILFLVGMVGLFDEWDLAFDVLRGFLPLLSCMIGIFALTTGINKLKA